MHHVYTGDTVGNSRKSDNSCQPHAREGVCQLQPIQSLQSSSSCSNLSVGGRSREGNLKGIKRDGQGEEGEEGGGQGGAGGGGGGEGGGREGGWRGAWRGAWRGGEEGGGRRRGKEGAGRGEGGGMEQCPGSHANWPMSMMSTDPIVSGII